METNIEIKQSDYYILKAYIQAQHLLETLDDVENESKMNIKFITKKYKNKEDALKYIEGRKEYYKEKYFTERKPAIPKEYYTKNLYRSGRGSNSGTQIAYYKGLKLEGYTLGDYIIK